MPENLPAASGAKDHPDAPSARITVDQADAVHASPAAAPTAAPSVEGDPPSGATPGASANGTPSKAVPADCDDSTKPVETPPPAVDAPLPGTTHSAADNLTKPEATPPAVPSSFSAPTDAPDAGDVPARTAMRIDVLTIFPEMFAALDHTIPSRARKAGALDLRVHGLREFAVNRYGAVDDYPYGGEPGMVMRPEPIERCLEKALEGRTGVPVLYPCPHGKPLTQEDVRQWAAAPELILLCGHYKGIDERVRRQLVTHEFSVGDFVLSGGEIPTLAFIDAVARLLPGVLGDEGSARTDSFEDDLLGWPVYTRPEVWAGERVPEIMLSGHHAKIRAWQRLQRLLLTRELRPDLWAKFQPSREDQALLDSHSRRIIPHP